MDVSSTRAPQKHLASWLDLDVFQIGIASVYVQMVSPFIPQQTNKVIQQHKSPLLLREMDMYMEYTAVQTTSEKELIHD